MPAEHSNHVSPGLVDADDSRVGCLVREQRSDDPDSGSHRSDDYESVDLVPPLTNSCRQLAVTPFVRQA